MSKSTLCPECRAKIIIDDYMEEGEMIFCDECGIRLVIISLKPLKLEVKEDVDSFIDYDDDY